MGPAATAEFLRLLAARTPAQKDSDHPIIYVLSDTSTPDRSAGILGTGENPSAQIQKNLETLAAWGADFLAVPCNTAHYFIDRFTKPLPIPLVHIVKETLLDAKKIAPRAWILATLGTMKSGLYQFHAQEIGYDLLMPSDEIQAEVEIVLRLVKSGELEKSGAEFKKIVQKLWTIDDAPVLTACTELPLAYDNSGLPHEKSVSSLQALAKACVREISF